MEKLDKIAEKYTIRTEQPRDFKIVENLTREAFWNVYRPGCVEHFVLHHYRNDPSFIPELSLVMEVDGQIIGHVMYAWSKIDADNGRKIRMMTFGPISIHPNYKRQGYGKALLDYSMELARKMGADAAVNVAKEDLQEVMKQQGLVEGFDVGLEMSGSGAAFKQLLSVMRNGGKVSLLGLGNGPISLDMNLIIGKGLTLQGIYGRKMDNWHQMSYMVQGGLDLHPVITHRFHYTEFEKGFEAMHSGNSGKVIFDWTKK